MNDWSRQARVMELCSHAHLLWKRHLERQLQPHGVNIKQAYLLSRLRDAGFLRPAQVAEELFCDRPTATSLLDTLEKRGWIRRERDPADGRQRRVVLSAAGKRKLTNLPTSASRAAPQDVDPLAPFSAGAADGLIRQMERLVANLERQVAQEE